MNILQKSYLKAKNQVEANVCRALNRTASGGLLSHKKDIRDKICGVFRRDKPKYSNLTIANNRWRFNQKPFNICVFAGGTKGSSFQEGIRFSVRARVMLAKKLGLITGNGFSYLRADLNLDVKYGRLPYTLMPDEIGDMSWAEYSKDLLTDEMMREMAKYKIPEYKRIDNPQKAVEALERGYALHTGNRWYGRMNKPQADGYLLVALGAYFGGHAWASTGYRGDGVTVKAFESLQSFGLDYGKEGMAFIESLFGKGQFPVYIKEKMEGRTDLERFLGAHEGVCVKGTAGTVYKIEGGLKRGFRQWESFKKLNVPFYCVSDKILEKVKEGESIL